jgi:group I intron endonuclease
MTLLRKKIPQAARPTSIQSSKNSDGPIKLPHVWFFSVIPLYIYITNATINFINLHYRNSERQILSFGRNQQVICCNIFLYKPWRYTHTSPTVPAIKTYDNADTQKKSIIEDNKGKAGIYFWINKKNGKTYIGSAINLANRFYAYYNLKYILKSNMTIGRALLKYGHSNFSLHILEYCEVHNVLEREQYYLDLLKPKYNILRLAGSSLGYRHTEETLAKFKERKHSEEARFKIGNSRIGMTLSEETRTKISTILKGVGGIKVWVTNIETKEIIEYKSLTEAALAVGVKSNHTIKKYLFSGELLYDKYFIGVDEEVQLPDNYSKKSNNSTSMPIIVTNVNTGEKREYISIYAASKELGISKPTLKKYLDKGECYKKIYDIRSRS